jgi:hypothetical protein
METSDSISGGIEPSLGAVRGAFEGWVGYGRRLLPVERGLM